MDRGIGEQSVIAREFVGGHDLPVNDAAAVPVVNTHEARVDNFVLNVFIFAIVISLGRGLNIECGCFGTSSGSKVGIIKLVENSTLLIFSFLLTKFNSVYLSLTSDENKS